MNKESERWQINAETRVCSVEELLICATPIIAIQLYSREGICSPHFLSLFAPLLNTLFAQFFLYYQFGLVK